MEYFFQVKLNFWVSFWELYRLQERSLGSGLAIMNIENVSTSVHFSYF